MPPILSVEMKDQTAHSYEMLLTTWHHCQTHENLKTQ